MKSVSTENITFHLNLRKRGDSRKGIGTERIHSFYRSILNRNIEAEAEIFEISRKC